MNLARVLGEWSSARDWGQADRAAQIAVINSLIDTVGVALAATRDPRLDPIDAITDGPGSAQVWGQARRSSPALAAMRNATAAHLLDFDDVHYGIHGHPSAVLFPAVIAAADSAGVDGATMLSGYLAGIGVMAAMNHAFGPRHYSVGWHSTSTCGAIGAAAAVARVWGLDAQLSAYAMSIAASMAGGVRANFGTVVKPMHAGFAARAGVEAASLARAGVVPADDALGGRFGAVAVFGDGSWSLGDPVELLRIADEAPRGLAPKLYPSCRGSHYGISAALRVRDQLAADERVRRVHITLPLGGDTGMLYEHPATGLEAKFSARYTVVTALLRGLPTLDHFTDEAVDDSSVQELMRATRVRFDASAGDLSSTMIGRFAVVEVETSYGRVVSAREDDPVGSPTNPLTREQVHDKFLRCTGDGTLLATLVNAPDWYRMPELCG